MPAPATAGSKIRGFEGQLYYLVTGGSNALFANVIDFKITVKADSIDATDKSTTGWKDKEGGLKEWTGTIKANAIQAGTTATDAQNFLTALEGNTLLTGQFRPQDVTNGVQYSGNFRVTSWDYDAPISGMQTISMTIEGSGALTSGTVTAGGTP